jgi:hypothetical protein
MSSDVFTLDQIKALGEIFAQVQTKHNPTAGAATFPYAHGPGGLFSEPAVRPEMYSALVWPRTFFDAIPWKKSVYINELVSILTGQQAAQGTNATNTCGDPPYPGDLKKCTRASIFGELFLKTEKVAVTDIGRRNNRADVDRIIQNVKESLNPMIPDLLRRPGVNFMDTLSQALYMLGVQVARTIAPLEVTGNSGVAAGASTTPGVITEFDGLDNLIIDTHRDNATNQRCPAADSLIINWNRDIAGIFEGLNIAEMFNDVYFSRVMLADDTGMTGVRWAWVMDKRLFRALTFIFACTFQHTRCTDAAVGTPTQRQQSEIEARALEMMRGQFLWCNGEAIPVLFTAGTEVNIPDESGNDIIGDAYLSPMTWDRGDLLFGEYFPLNNEFIRGWEGIAKQNRVSHNDGMYLTAIRSDGFCDELLLSGRFRLRLDAPFLAARIDNITFDSYKGYRSFDPGGTFHYDGGVTYYT